MKQIDKCWWGMESTGVLPPQLSAEKQQEQLIADWAAKQPEDVRAVILNLPKLSSDASHVGMDKDAATWDEASESPDMPQLMDREHEQIMEQFGLMEAQAVGILEWARAREHNATRSVQARVLGTILGRFLGNKTSDAKVVFWALAFQCGLAKHLTDKNPHDKSKELGVTRALMSYWQKVWEDDLGLHDLTFAKTEEAREKYRAARVAYVKKKKGAA